MAAAMTQYALAELTIFDTETDLNAAMEARQQRCLARVAMVNRLPDIEPGELSKRRRRKWILAAVDMLAKARLIPGMADGTAWTRPSSARDVLLAAVTEAKQ